MFATSFNITSSLTNHAHTYFERSPLSDSISTHTFAIPHPRSRFAFQDPPQKVRSLILRNSEGPNAFRRVRMRFGGPELCPVDAPRFGGSGPPPKTRIPTFGTQKWKMQWCFQRKIWDFPCLVALFLRFRQNPDPKQTKFDVKSEKSAKSDFSSVFLAGISSNLGRFSGDFARFLLDFADFGRFSSFSRPSRLIMCRFPAF